MFGIGYQEMMVIALLALIIFGPGKLPEVMREAGKHYKKFKGMADEMTGELNKVTADARKELDGAFGDLGPMGKDLEKSLGMKSSSSTRTTSSGSKSGSSSTAKKSTTSSGKRTTSSSRSSSTSSTKKPSTSSSATGASKTTAAKTASTKPLVATKEDPLADFSLFEGEKKPKKKRSRTAAPSAITDFTPRDIFAESEPEMAEMSPLSGSVDIATLEDPIARARARRQSAGYARV